MIYGTKLLDTDIEIFIAALTKTPVYVWSLDPFGVYYQVNSGFIVKYTPDEVRILSEKDATTTQWYSRETNEFSISF
ncbi:hypothetical protein SAMN04487897_104292 [Paenibacillus sp. yr247]|uniref:hypothetical protein n=1 Tax=Paenibacillus sp. yr247 TaxID=1761880 RepID=UPI0008835895|nr:hypothetical protein [Paenibacillus sp. yr247]SDN75160.1 hypothetical protein SAMN04487897_104292 [Paenibacillus sp. yr247]